MSKKTDQAENELRIFRKFAKICPYSIDLNSIEKREPPEPDILCKTVDGEMLAFEIVIGIDRSLASFIYGSYELVNSFYDELESLPVNQNKRIKSIYGNASINVVFKEDISLEQKRNATRKILLSLISDDNEKRLERINKSLPSLIVTKYDLAVKPSLKEIIDCIILYPHKQDSGLSFDITEPLSIDDQIEKLLKQKIDSSYRTSCETELLAHYELQIEFPLEDWVLPAFNSVSERLNESVFQRIWLYSVADDKIVYVHPKIKTEFHLIKS